MNIQDEAYSEDEAGDQEDRKQQLGLVFPYKGHRVEIVLAPANGCYGEILIDGESRCRDIEHVRWLWLAEKHAKQLIDADEARRQQEGK